MKRASASIRLARGVTVASLLVAATAACSPTTATRGHLFEETRLSEIEPGRSTRNDVAAILGSPSTVSAFEPDVWYYIGQVTEQTAFFDPDVVERQVLVVTFNPQGVVEMLDQRDRDDGARVELVDRETPTLGRQMTFIEQMIGNFGRFNNAGASR